MRNGDFNYFGYLQLRCRRELRPSPPQFGDLLIDFFSGGHNAFSAADILMEEPEGIPLLRLMTTVPSILILRFSISLLLFYILLMVIPPNNWSIL